MNITIFEISFNTQGFLSVRLPTQVLYRGGPGSNQGLVMWDFLMDKSGAGAGFLRELRFPLPIYIPSVSP
jgi:hypothetical protein